ncbi:MAG: hypothetical protein IJ756_01085 [Paludibacteraceae bacterium]|nr:hypothetical protein [Paludibacteraceae bacterium]
MDNRFNIIIAQGMIATEVIIQTGNSIVVLSFAVGLLIAADGISQCSCVGIQTATSI